MSRLPGWAAGTRQQNEDISIPGTEADASTGSYADVVERLFAEFDGRQSLATIVDVVHQCRCDLDGGVPVGSLSELWVRLARERLQSSLEP